MTSTAADEIPIIPGLLPGTVKGGDTYPAVDVTDPTQSPAGSTKSYTIAQLYSFIISGLGFNVYAPVLTASTANLISTYYNGPGGFGVGATLTNSGTLVPFVLDGQVGILNGRYLIKNQTDPTQNGIYILSNIGSVTSAWVLTRSIDFNAPSEIIDNSIVFVINGVVNQNSSWQLSFTGSVTIGTTPFSWAEFNITAFEAFKWNTVSLTAANIFANNGYIPTSSSLTVFTLPSIANVGDVFKIKGFGSGGWKVAQNSLQQIILGSSLSTIGTGGYIASTNRYDDIELTCIVANTTFSAGPPQGIITVN